MYTSVFPPTPYPPLLHLLVQPPMPRHTPDKQEGVFPWSTHSPSLLPVYPGPSHPVGRPNASQPPYHRPVSSPPPLIICDCCIEALKIPYTWASSRYIFSFPWVRTTGPTITPLVQLFCQLSSITIEYPNIGLNQYSLT